VLVVSITILKKRLMKRKCLAVGIILLFIGIAVAPSINSTAVKTSDDNDLVEVISQACGIKGFGNTTVKLTKEQYQNLEQYLATFRARLNQTTTKEEAIPIFKEAAAELNTYGLLPKGMSVRQAQKLVTSSYASHQGSRLLEKIPHRNALTQNKVDNRFCLVAGSTNNNYIFGPIKSSLFIALLLLMDTIEIIALTLDSLGLQRLAALCIVVDDFLDFLWIPVRVIPAEIGGAVTFGSTYNEWEVGPHYYASNGWVFTQGLQGMQSLNGSFYGTIREGTLGFYWGLTGFTGIVIRPWGTGRMLFLGSAFRAGLSPDHL
jgi:hypothetical protein